MDAIRKCVYTALKFRSFKLLSSSIVKRKHRMKGLPLRRVRAPLMLVIKPVFLGPAGFQSTWSLCYIKQLKGTRSVMQQHKEHSVHGT
jgi:hypothetical protein